MTNADSDRLGGWGGGVCQQWDPHHMPPPIPLFKAEKESGWGPPYTPALKATTVWLYRGGPALGDGRHFWESPSPSLSPHKRALIHRSAPLHL